jgi:Uma2 family endonuclease
MDTTVIERGVTLETLDQYPMDDGNRYELIEGDVHVTTQPHLEHQHILGLLYMQLATWSAETRTGAAYIAPGVIFSDENAVAPDLVWVSHERALVVVNRDDGRLYGAPDLAIEILSSGSVNERRDRQDKLHLYDRFGVQEYWIVDRFARQVEVYRRPSDQLVFLANRATNDDLTSPLLPGFICSVAVLFQ